MEEYRDENGKLLATVVRHNPNHKGVQFFTSPEDAIQVGKVQYAENCKIPKHIHRPLNRISVGTVEILLVLKGQMEVTICGEGWEYQHFILNELDAVILQPESHHGFKMLKETVLFECKSGPYRGRAEDKIIEE